jgi:hypothetical protein
MNAESLELMLVVLGLFGLCVVGTIGMIAWTRHTLHDEEPTP